VFVERITNKELVKIKQALPVKEYRLLKNRKSARDCRKRKKQERLEALNLINALKEENKLLKEKLMLLKQA